ncbi:hypothetical protein KW784_00555 [Candidatus Parcubacteria bacterium]|nr:hypothetical protein [Candidatus Parcubacteria bacterium]
MMQFRMYPVVGSNVLQIHVNQQLLHDKGPITLFPKDSEAVAKAKLETKSPCATKVATFYWTLRGLPGTTGWMTIYQFFVDVGYESDCFEAELAVWVREALEFLSSDGNIEPMKETIVPITKKLRLE